MKCQKNRMCVKQPGNSQPIPKGSKMCTGCDKPAKDVKDIADRASQNINWFRKEATGLASSMVKLSPILESFKKEVEQYLPRKKTITKFRCSHCHDNGFMFYADSFDKDNGSPCPMCNPAGLCRESWTSENTLGFINIVAQPCGTKSRKATVRYACGYSVKIESNGHLRGKKTECPTICPKHKHPVKSYTEKLEME